jgi:hypothetical protein
VTDGGAAVAEDFSYLRGGLARVRLVDQVEEAKADGDRLGDGEVSAIPAIVVPSSLSRVGGGSVEFDAESIGLVKVVQVPVSRPVPDASLPSGRRQPMRAFHATYVPAFEPREHAFAGIVERCLDLAPHGKPVASVQRGTDPLRRGTPLAERLADPVVSLISGAGHPDEVEHGVFDAGAWRRHGGMTSA